MKEKDKHPSRKEIIRAVESGNIPFSKHLQQCIECFTLYKLIKLYFGDNTLAIEKPAPNSIKRFSAIPLLAKVHKKQKHQFGKLVFDSWAQLPALQLRDISPGFIRRLSLRAGKIKLEIIAERQQETWEFTARVYDSGNVSMEWGLLAGGEKLLPKSLGFYQWSSMKKPHRIRIFNINRQIKFEKISWV